MARRIKARLFREPPPPPPQPPRTLDQRRELMEARAVNMEREAYLQDFEDLEFEGRTLSSIFTERRWMSICEQTGLVCATLVSEFYCYFLERDKAQATYDITLREVSVTFSADKNNEFLSITRLEGPSYPDQEEEIANRLMLSNSELYKLLTEKEEVPYHLSNIPHNAMSDFFRMLHLIVAYNIDPRRRTSEASFERVKLMVYIVRGSQ
ncbi:hypothetical protein CJ030_MR4G010958 [Morella rubra]|uniref:Uncharacterized protein n=2 Tax=Morella rubra TaxID=262757 RepID=A0A6A1VWA0_9ROSI|nr:hypothetical protein CJ030_MR4G010958 [Morella rubra]